MGNLFGDIIYSLSQNFISLISHFEKSCCPIFFILVCKKPAATRESICSDAYNRVGDGNRGKITTIKESIFPYARNGIVFPLMGNLFGDTIRFLYFSTCISYSEKSCCSILFIVICKKSVATQKSIFFNIYNGEGNGNGYHIVASCESPFSYARNGIVFPLIRYLFGDDGSNNTVLCTANLRRPVIV